MMPTSFNSPQRMATLSVRDAIPDLATDCSGIWLSAKGHELAKFGLLTEFQGRIVPALASLVAAWPDPRPAMRAGLLALLTAATPHGP